MDGDLIIVIIIIVIAICIGVGIKFIILWLAKKGFNKIEKKTDKSNK